MPPLLVLLVMLCCLSLLGMAFPSTWAADEGPTPQVAPRPNILFIFTDDHATAAI
jgi:hypothetical protein